MNTSNRAPVNARHSNSQDLYSKFSPTLSRSPQPYHRRSLSLLIQSESTGTEGRSRDHSTAASRSDSGDSGTEADDERGSILKGLPAPPLRARKGLRGRTPDHLSPADSPQVTPPAVVQTGNGFFSKSSNKDKRSQPGKHNIQDIEGYTRRRRGEILRRGTEVLLLGCISAVVGSSKEGSAALAHWRDELRSFALLTAALYSLYPLRLAFRAHVAGRSWAQAGRLGFHLPSRFDPGPLLYPVILPLLIAITLFDRELSFLPVNMVCGLSSLPRFITASPETANWGELLHWTISVLPIERPYTGHSPAPKSIPLSLKLESGGPVEREDLVLLFPLHQALITVLRYLTTTSLDHSEVELLCTALVNVLVFSRSPQAEILKALIWVGGLCLFLCCRNVLSWEVALARIPSWKFQRRPRHLSLVSRIDHSLCTILTRGKYKRLRHASSDSDDAGPSVKLSGRRPRLNLNLRGLTSLPHGKEPVSAVETVSDWKTLANGTATTPPRPPPPPSRRNTFTVFDRKRTFPSSLPRRRSSRLSSTPSHLSSLLSLSLEQARVRKYLYAGVVYCATLLIILVPVRRYVSQHALSGHEPFGWALGYLFGDLPPFRLWVVSNNLERWICLPPRPHPPPPGGPVGWVENQRQNVLGPANMRLVLSAYCAAVFATGMMVVLCLTSVVEVDTRRKVFHGIMVAMMLPTVFVDPCFISLALELVLAVFLLLDLFRASQLPPISRPLTMFLAPYVDGRDHRGPVIVSHIFLLVGCAIPLWLSLAGAPRRGLDPWDGWDTPIRDLSMVSGVICVGMGDAAASLIGRRYGKTKWCWGGGKSLEGSIAFAIAVTCGLMASHVWLRIGGWVNWQPGNLGLAAGKSFLAGTGASLLESVLTAANDNVVVPVGLWLIVCGLGI